MFPSAGFHTILETNEYKFDYSAKKEYLKKTLYRRINSSAIEKIGEEMYRLVSTDAEKNIIKNAGGKWILYHNKKFRNVVVGEHVNSENVITGWYKTEIKVKNEDGIDTKLVRFYKRVGAK